MGCIHLQFATGIVSSKLVSRHVHKPWGRTILPDIFTVKSSEPVGEIWFIGDEHSSILAKYLFTSENLSVQVHPDDEQARCRGLARGKTECWFIVDAEPGAVIGLGLRNEISPDTLRGAALDGTVEQLIAWRPVAAGDFYFVPPGTIHAIGAGISLLELQQNSDITYRLYDYGRGRDLHLDDGIAVACYDRYPQQLFRKVSPRTNVVLVDGPHFTLVHSNGDVMQNRDRLILPVVGYAAIGKEIAYAGECLLLRGGQQLDSVEGSLLVAAEPQVEAMPMRAAA